MEGTRRLSLIVGTFLLATVVVMGVIVFSFSAERGFLRPRYRLVTYFHNVQGLTAGAPVRLAGRDVGSVEFVTFSPLEEQLPPVRVVLQVDSAVQDRIRTDTVASIGTIGLLGDKYVELSMGTDFGRVLAENEEISSVSPLDINEAVQRGSEAIDNIARLSANVNQVVEDFGTTMGGKGIADSIAGVSDIVQEVQTGDGLLHSLIYDRYAGSGVESIERSLALMEGILEEVAQGQGILHSLIYDPTDDQDLVMQAVRAGAQLNEILEKVNRGEGTLGLLLNDPTLYEDIKILVGGAQRSFVVRSLVGIATDGAD